MYVEEISLTTSVDDLAEDRPADDKQALAVLQQTNWLRRCRSEFVLFDNHSLSVNTQGFMQKPLGYMIDIGILDPNPKRSLKICWRYFLSFLVLCGVAWIVAFTGVAQQTVLLSIIPGVCAGACLLLAIYRSHDRVVFYSQSGRVPLLVLFNRLPDRATLGSFSEALVRQIKHAKGRWQGDVEALNFELKAHRRLMEEGVISRKRYDIVKKRILSRHEN